MTTGTTTRFDTLFDLRYAVRVLERHGNLWSNLGGAFKFVSLVTGSTAVAAVISSNPQWATGLAIALAVLQAWELAVDPATRKADAAANRRDYARLLANESGKSDAELLTAYMSIVADDKIQPWRAVKELAYNDVIREKNLDPTALYANESKLMLWLI